MGRDLKAQRQSQEGKGRAAIGWAQQLTSGQVPSKTTLVLPQARAGVWASWAYAPGELRLRTGPCEALAGQFF